MLRVPGLARSVRIPRIVLPFLIGDFVMAGLYVANFTILREVGAARNFFHMGHESNLPTWFSALQLFMVAVLLAVLAVGMLRRREPHAWRLFLWPALFCFLSFDELAMVHERMPDAIRGAVFPVTGAWMLVYAPLMGGLTLLIAYLTRRYWWPHRDIALTFVAGFAVLGISAAGIEILTNFVRTPLQVHLQVLAEETGELIGMTILLWASHNLLVRHGLRFDVADLRAPADGPMTPISAASARTPHANTSTP